MDKKKQSILKQEVRIPLQEVGLPDFPDDDTTTATVTKSRRVSFGANFVKEFIVGSAVSAQFYSEYEQAFSSSDSSNPNSSRSGLLDHSTFNQEIIALDLCMNKSSSDKENKPLGQTFCSEKHKNVRKEANERGDDEHWEFSVGSGSDIFHSKNMNQSWRAETNKNKCSKKPIHVEDSFAEKVSHSKRNDHESTHQKFNDTFEKKTKHGKFSSTICFSADSPTADMEFTEGCISLAKSILDKKKQEMTVYIEAKPKENNREEKKEENGTIHFDASEVEMSLTKCVPSESYSDGSEFETDEEVPKPFQLLVSMDTSDSSESPGKEPQRLYQLDAILGRDVDSEDDGDLIRSLFFPERSLTEMLNSKSLKATQCESEATEDNNEECDMEVTDIEVPYIIRTDSSASVEPAMEVDEGRIDSQTEFTSQNDRPAQNTEISHQEDADTTLTKITNPGESFSINKIVDFREASVPVPSDVSNVAESRFTPDITCNITTNCPKPNEEDVVSNGEESSSPLSTDSKIATSSFQDDTYSSNHEKPENCSFNSNKETDINYEEECLLSLVSGNASMACDDAASENWTPVASTQEDEICKEELSLSLPSGMINKVTEDLTLTDNCCQLPETNANQENSAVINSQEDNLLFLTSNIEKEAEIDATYNDVRTKNLENDSIQQNEEEAQVENLLPDLVLSVDDANSEHSPSYPENLSLQTENLEQIERSFCDEDVDVEKSLLLPNGSSFDPPAASTCHNPVAMLKRKSMCDEVRADDTGIRSFTLEIPVLQSSTGSSTNAAENSLLLESFCCDSRWETEDCPRATKRFRQGRYPSAGDQKILLLLKEQSQETNCCWEIGGFTYEDSSPNWYFVLEMLDMVVEMKFDLKLPKDMSLVSFSSIVKTNIELKETGRERKAEIDFAFKKFKKHFVAESSGLETIHKMPLFLDKMNLFASKTRTLMIQLRQITKEYPGSRLKESALSFRLYSFPLLFSCLISVDISDSLLLAESSVSVKRHFGRFSESQARSLFEECLKSENVLVSFVRSLNQLVIGLELNTGRVTNREHVRLLK